MMNRRRHALLTILGGLAVATTLYGQTQNPRMSLQAAIKLELVDGDLAGAMARYTELSQNADPSIAAEALVRLAGGYTKLGQSSEARTAYERIVRDHPDQTEAVAGARRWLAAQSPAPVAPAIRREELVWTGPEVDFDGRTTADGRYLFFAWLEGGMSNLAVRELATGDQRVLTGNAISEGWIGNPVPSADGRRIAYRFSPKESTIRLMNADGTNIRVLLHDDDYDLYLQAWSPDSRFLIATRRNPDRTYAIVLISTDDGSTTQVKTVGPRRVEVGGFSADARYVLYALHQVQGVPTDTGGVYLLPIDLSTGGSPKVGSEIALVEGPAAFMTPLWTPDGRRVVFSSTRSQSLEPWTVGVTNGRPAGEPERVQIGRRGVTLLSVTSDGSLYYRANERRDEAYSADFDPATLTVGTPVPVTDRGIGNNRNPAWSPDGTSVAFLRRLPGRNAPGGAPVIVRDSRTGAERQVTRLGRGSYGARILEWFPDGRSLLVSDGIVQGERRRLFRQVDVQSGEVQVVFDGPWNVEDGALAADGRALFYAIREEGAIRLVKRQLDTGEETELSRRAAGGFAGLSASPDGTRLAFVASTDGTDGLERALVVATTDTGTEREVYRVQSLDEIQPGQGLTWTADSRHVVFTGRCVPDKPNVSEDSWQLCAVPAEGGDVRFLGLSMPDIISRQVSPDGRRIAFTGTTVAREVWVARQPFADGR